MTENDDPVFFETPAAWRAWLRANHRTARALVVGFWKRGTGRPSITWPESVDEALCFGWIDGVRRRLDEDRYTIRFTPRQPRSIWSAVNIKRVEVLGRDGRMTKAGLAAYAKREDSRSERYAYEQRHAPLDPVIESRIRANAKAWAFWTAQPPGYRKTAGWWITSAKRDDTRERRLAQLIEDCANGRRLGPLARKTE